MTLRDPMPFGKYGPKRQGGALSIGEVLEKEPKYVEWLLEQDWIQKNPVLVALFTKGAAAEQETSTPAERAVLTGEETLMNSVSTSFKTQWAGAYGERLRKQGELNYIAYLRVAIEAWSAAERTMAEHFQSGPEEDHQ